MKQIHIDVDPLFWGELLLLTKDWPRANRTQQGICNFAMRELAARTQRDTLPRPAPLGRTHIQVRTHDTKEASSWDLLSTSFGGQNTVMLRAALAFLKSILERPEE